MGETGQFEYVSIHLNLSICIDNTQQSSSLLKLKFCVFSTAGHIWTSQESTLLTVWIKLIIWLFYSEIISLQVAYPKWLFQN